MSPEFPSETTPVFAADREETAEKLLGEMEANAIDQAMLVQIGGDDIAHHAYLLHCLKIYPDRFLGIGLIPPDLSEPQAHMDTLTDGTGIIGFRLSSLGGPRDLFDRRKIIHASDTKVRVDVGFSSCREDDTVIESIDALYILTKEDGRWGVKMRSSYA